MPAYIDLESTEDTTVAPTLVDAMQRELDIVVRVRPLIVSGTTTTWAILSVPSKAIARADAFVRGWKAFQRAEYERSTAPRAEAK